MVASKGLGSGNLDSWASYPTFLTFSFFICQVRIILFRGVEEKMDVTVLSGLYQTVDCKGEVGKWKGSSKPGLLYSVASSR